jgi:hypothetical protein
MTDSKLTWQRSALLPIAIGAVASLLAVAGCGDGRPKRVPVSGQVLIDGQPLSFGYIGFVPEHDRPSVAKLDKHGRFTMACFDVDDGVVVGKHAVEVIAREPLGEDRLRWHAPKKYASSETSGLVEEITEPTDSLTINLTWDGQRGPFVEVLR